MNSSESSAAGAEKRRRHVLALVADASADGQLQGLTAALQRVCRAASAALGLRGAAVHASALPREPAEVTAWLSEVVGA